MSEEVSAQSCVSSFYKGKTIFITGATGFMGKVLLEKLLRSCPDIHKVFVLVRPKKGQAPHERVEALTQSPLYTKLRESMSDLCERIVAINGDILEPRLGMSPEDEARVAAETQIVFHSAATVKFDEELKLSVKMNVIGTKMIVELAKKMTNLEALIHVSTAYANCDREMVQEKVYDPPLHPNKLIDAIEWMDKEAVEALTSKLIGSRPNTYTYTKAVAEYLFMEESKGLPTAIVRPSIVGASWEEPLPGWVDNLNGPSGLLAAIGKGLLFTMQGNTQCTADIIPVDIATNAMIVVAWHTAIHKPAEALVYNCTTGQMNNLTWGTFQDSLSQYFRKNPCSQVLKVPNPRFTLNTFWRDTWWFFEQMVPAYAMDVCYRLAGKRPMFVRMQDRLSKATSTLEFFTSNQWEFHNHNIYMLLQHMTHQDQRTFCFDPRSINWSKYIDNYCSGVQQYVLKEDMSKLPKARQALLRLQRIQTLLKVIGGVIVWRLLVKRVPVFHSLWALLLSWVQFLFVRLPTVARSS